MTKKIEAIIREDQFNDVKDALRKIGIVGMNVLRSTRAGPPGRNHPHRAQRHVPDRHAAPLTAQHYSQRSQRGKDG